MTEVIHHDTDSSSTLLVAVIIIVVAIAAFFIWRGSSTQNGNADIKVQLPGNGSGSNY